MVEYVLQPYAGWAWTWGTVTLDGSATCEYGKDCPGFLYIVCGDSTVSKGCAVDASGNIGKGNTGINNIGNDNTGNVSA